MKEFCSHVLPDTSKVIDINLFLIYDDVGIIRMNMNMNINRSIDQSNESRTYFMF